MGPIPSSAKVPNGQVRLEPASGISAAMCYSWLGSNPDICGEAGTCDDNWKKRTCTAFWSVLQVRKKQDLQAQAAFPLSPAGTPRVLERRMEPKGHLLPRGTSVLAGIYIHLPCRLEGKGSLIFSPLLGGICKPRSSWPCWSCRTCWPQWSSGSRRSCRAHWIYGPSRSRSSCLFDSRHLHI